MNLLQTYWVFSSICGCLARANQMIFAGLLCFTDHIFLNTPYTQILFTSFIGVIFYIKTHRFPESSTLCCSFLSLVCQIPTVTYLASQSISSFLSGYLPSNLQTPISLCNDSLMITFYSLHKFDSSWYIVESYYKYALQASFLNAEIRILGAFISIWYYGSSFSTIEKYHIGTLHCFFSHVFLFLY